MVMFTKEFRTTFISFIHLMLKRKHVTKAEIKKIFLLFESIWIKQLKKTKTVKKNEKKAH